MSLEKCNTKTQSHEDTKSVNELSHQIIGASIEVHRTLGGPGLEDYVYNAKDQVIYKGIAIREPLFIDVLVENKVLVEIKATETNHPIYETQVLTYLRLTGIKLG